MPDRPGALGQVASRIGAVRGDVNRHDVLASDGPVPPAAWLEAFVEGSRSSGRVVSGEAGPEDVAWAPLPTAELVLVLGRGGRPLRARERRQIAALARIADTRC